ncbi:hypothetical protein D3C79_961790 [compost metagenome]
MLVQRFGFDWRAALSQVSRAGAVHSLDGSDAPGNQRRIFQRADAQGQVVTFAKQIHRPIAQVHLRRDVRVALQKLR